ncbi:MAG: MBL fold metallo-hydrolase [Thermomicrobium sp.]|nr:MBL fold metallo-hydrolase [Thermomicrobium sp.]MCS7246101.1 MBL fold metallo-hydrolase [Thermomicrobium sp.]MDW7981770.1 MBL fold metallo-hydrolase [Thermomicrobium sp.]
MEVHCFGSGSGGNAFLLRSDRAAILVDAGFTPSMLRRALRACGVRDHELSAIVITHEHRDHVRGLTGLLRWHSCPVLATDGTFRALRVDWMRRTRLVAGQSLEVGDLVILPIATAHDANEPIGLRVTAPRASLALFTDLGSVTPEVIDALQTATLVVLEANHDPMLLATGPYPAWLKRRIASPVGHLSNDQAAHAAAHLSPAVQMLWLAHLSEENNRPELAVGTVRERLRDAGGVPVFPLPPRGLVTWKAGASSCPLPLVYPMPSPRKEVTG